MDKELFGIQLQKYRELAGYSQEDLAEKVDCSTIFISYIERGQKSPSLKTFMNLPADVLLGNETVNYTSEKLKHMVKRLNILPAKEQQRILDIMEEAITIELKYYERQGEK